MRLKKIAAAAVAMVMAVSMMAVPVFAAAGTVDISDQAPFDADTNQASTKVNLVYSSAANNLSVTVPLNLTFAIKSDGTLQFPNDYKIINNSVVPVHVTNIQVTMIDGDYALVNAEPAERQVRLSMTANSDGAHDTVHFVANEKAQNEPQTFGQDAATKKAWVIAAGKLLSGNATGKELTLTFGDDGKVGSIKTDWANKATEFCSITYTIAAGTAD